MSWTQSVYTTIFGWRIICNNHRYFDQWIIHNCTNFNSQDHTIYAEIKFYPFGFLGFKSFGYFYREWSKGSFLQISLPLTTIKVEQSFEPKIDVMKIVSQLNKLPFFQYESFIYKLLFDYAVLLSDRVENGEEEMIKLFINDGIKELLETMEQCSIKGWCEDEKH